jgi:hypothetical protein
MIDKEEEKFNELNSLYNKIKGYIYNKKNDELEVLNFFLSKKNQYLIKYTYYKPSIKTCTTDHFFDSESQYLDKLVMYFVVEKTTYLEKDQDFFMEIYSKCDYWCQNLDELIKHNYKTFIPIYEKSRLENTIATNNKITTTIKI